jgi:hypothetical protein
MSSSSRRFGGYEVKLLVKTHSAGQKPRHHLCTRRVQDQAEEVKIQAQLARQGWCFRPIRELECRSCSECGAHKPLTAFAWRQLARSSLTCKQCTERAETRARCEKQARLELKQVKNGLHGLSFVPPLPIPKPYILLPRPKPRSALYRTPTPRSPGASSFNQTSGVTGRSTDRSPGASSFNQTSDRTSPSSARAVDAVYKDTDTGPRRRGRHKGRPRRRPKGPD